VKLQAQAVLRREDPAAPPRLVGVLMAGSFHPLTAQDALGPMHLEAGLVALAPLTTVVASDAITGAARAMVEASSQWGDPGPARGELLSWVPIDQVRDVAEEDIHALIVRMGIDLEDRTLTVRPTLQGSELAPDEDGARPAQAHLAGNGGDSAT